MNAEALTYAMSLDQARRITERIRIQITNVRDGLEKLQQHVDIAREGRAWEVLGYKSWTAYLSDVMGEEPLRLSRDERREVVELLAGEGMSTRAIAPIVGVQHSAVAKDLRRAGVSTGHTSSSGPSTPSPESTVRESRTVAANASVVSVPGPVAQESTSDKATDGTAKVAVPGSQDGEDRMGASDVGDGHVDPSDISRPAVTGMDGKTYPRTSPGTKPRRTPLPKTFTSAVLDVERRLKTLRDLTQDDRWPTNKNQVATMHGSDLGRIDDLLQGIRQSLK